MKKPSDVFKSIRYAKMEPQHDKGHAGGSTDDEEHGAIGEKEWGEQLKHAKKRAMMNTEEVKDKTDIGEYDQEGDMAKSDLRSIIANAQKLHDMIDDADNLPEWVQSKITLAEDYISTVANYMNSEMNEGLEEAMSPAKQETPPFDGPYKKAVGTVTDKSGAKHTPMSRARDLARNAALKQAQSMKKESLEESRKAEIVKETFKKAKTKKSDDTFQSEPVLGSSVVKSDN